MTVISGRFLVKNDGNNRTDASPMLLSNIPLSFWGGIEPETGKVIDVSHNWHGQSVKDRIICLPSGRGSCTASQVLLELILQDKAPRAIVLRDVDGLVCVGALIAQEVFQAPVPDIICVDDFDSLLHEEPSYGAISEDGGIIVASSADEVEATAKELAGRKATDSSLDCLDMAEVEQEMIQSAVNEAERMATRVLVQYAKITMPSSFDRRYINVAKAHIDGVTYIGSGGLHFAQKLVAAGGRVKVPTTLNSVSADRSRWLQLGVPRDRALASIALGDAYLALGGQHSFTCAPYLLPDPPQQGQDLVWGESNAVVYANSVLGARTEKYADYLDICCAIVGKVPAGGMHIEENRRPRIVLDARNVLEQLWNEFIPSNEDIEVLFPLLGHLCGTLSDGYVPILLGFDNDEWPEYVTKDHLKAFCAAFGTTGTSPLILIAGISPETKDQTRVDALITNCDQPRRVVTMDGLQATFGTLDSSSDRDKVDLIALGNPHLSVSECRKLATLIEMYQGEGHQRAKTRIMACMSRALYEKADVSTVESLERFGVEVVNDTCWCMLLDSPVIPPHRDAVIMTNSGKYAHYGPGLTQRSFRFGSLSDCVEAAATGMTPKLQQAFGTYPKWLAGNEAKATIARRRRYSVVSWKGGASYSAKRQTRNRCCGGGRAGLVLHALALLAPSSAIR